MHASTHGPATQVYPERQPIRAEERWSLRMAPAPAACCAPDGCCEEPWVGRGGGLGKRAGEGRAAGAGGGWGGGYFRAAASSPSTHRAPRVPSSSGCFQGEAPWPESQPPTAPGKNWPSGRETPKGEPARGPHRRLGWGVGPEPLSPLKSGNKEAGKKTRRGKRLWGGRRVSPVSTASSTKVGTAEGGGSNPRREGRVAAAGSLGQLL